ncbi:MAG: hypothetical protein PHY42_04890 [Bacilli bacterium]|nr:hypothetical protein [Bacilli bacterium]
MKEKSFQKRVKLYLVMLLEPTTFLLMGGGILTVSVGNVILADICKSSSPYFYTMYQQVSCQITQIIYIILIVFIWHRLMSPRLEETTWLLMAMKTPRMKVFRTKLLILWSLNGIIGVVFFTCQTLVGWIIDSHYVVLFSTYREWVMIGLGGGVYGMFTMLLTQWRPSTMAILIPLILFIMVHNLSYEGILFSIFQILLGVGKPMNPLHVIWTSWFILLLTLLNRSIYQQRDFIFIEK